MKNLIYLSVLAVLMASCSSEPQYVLKGTLSGAEEGTVFLQKRVSGKMEKIDSAAIVNGAFEFAKSAVEYPDAYYLGVDGKRGYKMFFLENSEINITGHADSVYNAKVTGSQANDDYDAYNAMLEPYYEKNSELYQAYTTAKQEGDEEKAAELAKEREALFDEIEKAEMDWVKANPASYATPTILRSLMYGMEADELQGHLNDLDPKLMETEIAKSLTERVTALEKVAIGKEAPQFTMNDTEGNPVNLSDIVGPKLLLIDFWAAWCGPCRAENPNVVDAYQEYHEKGFDILGVSLDQDKDDWLKAISDDNLTWHHVSDLKYWENEAAKMYAVNAIPANFLLDSEGVIVAKNLRGLDLKAKLAELLGE